MKQQLMPMKYITAQVLPSYPSFHMHVNISIFHSQAGGTNSLL